MNVLFVISGNAKHGISPITLNQGESLKKAGLNIDYFTIKGRGLRGYLKSIPKLKTQLKETKYDLIHAHYSLSGLVASLAGAKPLIVSLMGSDVKGSKYYRIIIKFFHKIFWSATIVKSEDMKASLGIKNVLIIPNGVDLNKFKPCPKKEAFVVTKWDQSKRHILFAANPKLLVKNFKLANEAFDILSQSDIELHVLDNISNAHMPFYYNAADVVLLTSFWEGSPNVIKEAMACNCPIVATDVGDIKEVIGKTDGCHICSFEPNNLAFAIKKTLTFNNRTNGRKNILHLESNQVAKKIISTYNSVL